MHFFRRVVNCHFDLILCDGDGGEALMLQQHAKSVADVVKQPVHDSLGIVRQCEHRIGARGAKGGDNNQLVAQSFDRLEIELANLAGEGCDR